MTSREAGRCGLGCPAPILAVRDLEAACAFYARLGFGIRHHDAGYGHAERERVRLHLRASPELDQFANLAAVYVDTTEVDALHAAWLGCGLWLVPTVIGPQLHEEARRRWAAGEPVGRMTEVVEDKPWGIREFALLDLDNNQLRFGRPVG